MQQRIAAEETSTNVGSGGRFLPDGLRTRQGKTPPLSLARATGEFQLLAAEPGWLGAKIPFSPSDLRCLRDRQGIFHVDTEIPDGGLDLGVA